MPQNGTFQLGPLQENELAEADRIVRLAFATHLGIDPRNFMDDRDFMQSRWRARHVKAIAAREGERLIGSNIVTRWGSFGFFGPLTVLPDYWNHGVAQRLLEATMKVFDRWGVRRTGLFTFPNSAKHVALYQKFGYWPGYLTAIMTRPPEQGGEMPALLTDLTGTPRAEAIRACAKLTGALDRGLDLSDEIRALLAQHTGDVVLTHTRGSLDAFAVCLTGPGSEGGARICYVKFAAARVGRGADGRFEKLLAACEAYGSAHGATVEAGVSAVNEDAWRRMRARGYRAAVQGVTMQKPNVAGFLRPDAYVISDWR